MYEVALNRYHCKATPAYGCWVKYLFKIGMFPRYKVRLKSPGIATLSGVEDGAKCKIYQTLF